MKKLLVLIVLALFLSACAKDTSQISQNGPAPAENTSTGNPNNPNNPNNASIDAANPISNQTSQDDGGQLETVYWGVLDVFKISNKAKADISAYLKRNGMDFAIKFVELDTGNHGKAIKDYAAAGRQLDIIYAGFADYEGFALDLLADGKLDKLDDFLLENPDIKAQFPEALWKSVTYGDSVYAIPSWLSYGAVDYAFNPSKFGSEIDEFTASESDLLDLYSRESTTIAMCVGSSEILPCNELYGIGFPHDGEAPVNTFARYSEILKLMNKRSAEGSLTHITDIAPSDTRQFDVYIRSMWARDSISIPDGYVTKRVKSHPQPHFMGLAVLSGGNADRAKALLQKVYADPELANLLIYGSNGTDYALKDGFAYNPDGTWRNAFGNSFALGRSFYKGLLPTQDESLFYPQDVPDPIKYFEENMSISPYMGFIPQRNGREIGEIERIAQARSTAIEQLVAYQTDPETGERHIIAADKWLEETMKELEDAGFGEWLESVTKQYEDWKKSK